MFWRPIFLLMLVMGCGGLYRGMIMTDQSSQVANALAATNYEKLFMIYGDHHIDAIWTLPNAPTALAALVMDNSMDLKVRFLAAEILYYKDSTYPPESAKAALAEIYADALANDTIGVANPWGLPGYLDSVGQHVVGLGTVAVKSLTTLLDDDTEILFEGSEEATIGNGYEYRVKDFAAYFISQITGIPYTIYQTPAERDAEIARLKAQLP
jgi:hypothetical protein